MLEDSRMEKKTANRSQPQSRASAVDCKKSSELTCKPCPRHNKRREAPVNAPKNEQYRKNVPATRGRGLVDKRPRSRGNAGFVMGGATDAGIAQEEPELGSVMLPGSKKQNINHLLNFMYTPRGAMDRNRGMFPPKRHYPQTPMKKHNQDLYLQASCQFVVKEGGDYTANLMDPDKLIDWNLIEEIVVRGHGRAECPVCLGAPVAGRVGRCGHVHCWPCALHYAAAHALSPPPCPVCALPFRVPLMKPAKLVQWDAPAEQVCMRLVRRLRGSTVVEVAPPRDQITEPFATSLLPIEVINDAPYAKFFGATDQQVKDILERERKELQDQILEEIDTTEIVFIEEALALLKVQEEEMSSRIINENASSSSHSSHDEAELVPTVYEKQSTSTAKIDWFDEETAVIENNNKDIEDVTKGIDKVNLNPEAAEFVNNDVFPVNEAEFPLIDLPDGSECADDVDLLTDLDKENKSKYFYFYQAEDGQQVFLDSLNVRMLNASWGALAAAPREVRGRVLHRETSSLTDQIRKHTPFAAHLPLHCPFDIVELELVPPYVNEGALREFAAEVERRGRARARARQRERRRERTRAEGDAGDRAARGGGVAGDGGRPDLTSPALFPAALPVVTSTPTDVITTTSPTSSTGLSFAKMASTSGAWHVRAARPPAPSSPRRSPSPSRGEEAAAPRALLLSDAVEAALLAAHTTSKGRNKKAKRKVLFSTGMQRATE